MFALTGALAAATLWILLPPIGLGFAAFVSLYTVASIAGVISHVPAGLGVFEAVLLIALPAEAHAPGVAAAAVVLRELDLPDRLSHEVDAQRLALEQGIESALLRYLFSLRMHVHADACQQPRIFKLLAFAKHDMTYERVFALEQRGT